MREEKRKKKKEVEGRVTQSSYSKRASRDGRWVHSDDAVREVLRYSGANWLLCGMRNKKKKRKKKGRPGKQILKGKKRERFETKYGGGKGEQLAGGEGAEQSPYTDKEHRWGRRDLDSTTTQNYWGSRVEHFLLFGSFWFLFGGSHPTGTAV